MNVNKNNSVNEPTARNSCSLNFELKKKRLILFGGADTSKPLADMYYYDLGNFHLSFYFYFLFYKSSIKFFVRIYFFYY